MCMAAYRDWKQALVREKIVKVRHDATKPWDLLVDSAQRFLEDNLLRRGGAHDLREVPTMGLVPVGPSRVVHPETKEEGLQAELRGLERHEGGVAGAAHIPKCFVLDTGDVHAGQ